MFIRKQFWSRTVYDNFIPIYKDSVEGGLFVLKNGKYELNGTINKIKKKQFGIMDTNLILNNIDNYHEDIVYSNVRYVLGKLRQVFSLLESQYICNRIILEIDQNEYYAFGAIAYRRSSYLYYVTLKYKYRERLFQFRYPFLSNFHKSDLMGKSIDFVKVVQSISPYDGIDLKEQHSSILLDGQTTSVVLHEALGHLLEFDNYSKLKNVFHEDLNFFMNDSMSSIFQKSPRYYDDFLNKTKTTKMNVSKELIDLIDQNSGNLFSKTIYDKPIFRCGNIISKFKQKKGIDINHLCTFFDFQGGCFLGPIVLLYEGFIRIDSNVFFCKKILLDTFLLLQSIRLYPNKRVNPYLVLCNKGGQSNYLQKISVMQSVIDSKAILEYEIDIFN